MATFKLKRKTFSIFATLGRAVTKGSTVRALGREHGKKGALKALEAKGKSVAKWGAGIGAAGGATVWGVNKLSGKGASNQLSKQGY